MPLRVIEQWEQGLCRGSYLHPMPSEGFADFALGDLRIDQPPVRPSSVQTRGQDRPPPARRAASRSARKVSMMMRVIHFALHPSGLVAPEFHRQPQVCPPGYTVRIAVDAAPVAHFHVSERVFPARLRRVLTPSGAFGIRRRNVIP